MINVIPAESKSDIKTFMYFPERHYAGDPFWAPPLYMSEAKLLSKNGHPFYRHAEAKFFLCRKDGLLCGRIAAIVDANAPVENGKKVGSWGFFECADDAECAMELFSAAERFWKENGVSIARGPFNPNINETCGLLVEGFDSTPMILMTYNKPYYAKLVESCGNAATTTLLAYRFDVDKAKTETIERFRRLSKSIMEREQVKIRRLDYSKFGEEVRLICKIFNDGWSNNWGFVPMTEAEATNMSKDLKPLAEAFPGLILIAEIKGKPAAFALALPDINPLVKSIRGRLLPFGWLKLLTGVKKIDVFRVVGLGIIKEFQSSGIGALLYLTLLDEGFRIGAKWGEFSWILEDNMMMRSPLEKMGAYVYKRYRIYEKHV